MRATVAAWALVLAAMFMALPGAAAEPAIRHVVVIAMENTDAARSNSIWQHGRYVYGNSRAPYINDTLMPRYAHAVAFSDPLPKSVPSEPHYIWMEAGTNAFADYTFERDWEPSRENSTASTDHLVTQLTRAGRSWMTYQEGLDETAGSCPIEESGNYAPKHNPFVFFQDVAGDPPRPDSAACASHTRPYRDLAADLAAGRMADYVFVTPDICHDGHDSCAGKDRVEAADGWLRDQLPPLIEWARANAGVIFVVWDEGRSTLKLPFLAIGPGVKRGHAGEVAYDHGSLVRSVEEIFGLPILPAVRHNNGFADLFRPGAYP